MKILVSGHMGFVGSNLCERLLSLGHEVIGIDNGSTGTIVNPKVKIHKCRNLCDSDSFDLKGIDVVFHVAATARIPRSFEFPQSYYKNNILSTLNLLEACRKQGIKKFIYSSSSSVIEPSNPYAHSKLIGEELCEMYHHLYGMNIQVLRYFNVYGKNMAHGSYSTVLQKFKDAVDSKKSIELFGMGKQRRDFTWVEDVIDANLLMLNETEYGVYDVGSGVNYSISEIAQAFNPKSIVYTDGFVGRNETLANIEPLKRKGYSPKGNVLNWIKNEFI